MQFQTHRRARFTPIDYSVDSGYKSIMPRTILRRFRLGKQMHHTEELTRDANRKIEIVKSTPMDK